MPKKTKKGKDRLDKYYDLAKQQGFRSRASFKLIQLNRVYGFLQKSQTIVDLCAAPGSWMQVCAKYMPLSGFCVGVDLDPIKKIKGCVGIQGDITTQKTLEQIRTSLRNRPVDLVLNDGAPNVGGTWDRDSHNQCLLVLASLRICTELLSAGGTFVTKVFRNTDYNRLLWVLNQFFDRVDATKPLASRMTSAEIFLVCRGYRKPKQIDARLLDAKYIFQMMDAPPGTAEAKAPLGGKSAQGYESTSALVYEPISAFTFVTSDNAEALLSNANAITFTDPASQRVLRHKATDDEVKYVCSDLRSVMTKLTMRRLLKWREIVRKDLRAEEEAAVAGTGDGSIRIVGDEDDSDDDTANPTLAAGGDDDDDDDLDAQLLREVERSTRDKDRERRKRAKKMVRKRLKQAMLGTFSPQLGMDNEEMLGTLAGGLGSIPKATLEGAGAVGDSDSGSDSDDSDDSDVSIDSAAAAADAARDFERMDENADAVANAPAFRLQALDAKLKAAAAGRAGAGGTGVARMMGDDDEDIAGERGGVYGVAAKKRAAAALRGHALYMADDDRVVSDIESETDDDDDSAADDGVDDDAFLRRIHAAFGSGRDSTAVEAPRKDAPEAPGKRVRGEAAGPAMSSATAAAFTAATGKSQPRKGGALAPSLMRLDQWDDDENALLTTLHPSMSTKTVVVDKADAERAAKSIHRPQLGEEQLEDDLEADQEADLLDALAEGESSSDDDDDDEENEGKPATKRQRLTTGYDEVPDMLRDPTKRAMALVLARKMLDKRERRELLEAGVNRWCFNDDEGDLPRWFVDDEKAHCFRELPVTKAEVEAEKQRFRELTQRAPKKIQQALQRKRRKATRLLKKQVEKEKKDPRYKGKSEGLTVRKLMRSKKSVARVSPYAHIPPTSPPAHTHVRPPSRQAQVQVRQVEGAPRWAPQEGEGQGAPSFLAAEEGWRQERQAQGARQGRHSASVVDRAQARRPRVQGVIWSTNTLHVQFVLFQLFIICMRCATPHLL